MSKSTQASPWKAVNRSGSWHIVGSNNETIATLGKSDRNEQYARLISASPYLLEALKAMVELIGEEDLPDNGELSGAAICDLARSAIDIAT